MDRSYREGMGISIWLKPHFQLHDFFTSMIYLLLVTTFLNQSVLSIDVGSFSLFLYRIVLIAATVIFLLTVLKEGNLSYYWNQVHTKGILLFLLLWMAYGCISLLWAKSVIDGFKYMTLLGMGILFVFLAVFTFTTIRSLYLFLMIWMSMTVFLMVLGFINHFAHIQLPTSTLYGGPSYKLSYPTSVFFNQNDFATFLSISFFFYLSMAGNSKSSFIKVTTLFLAVLSVYTIYVTESRASLLGVMLGLIAYGWILFPPFIKKLTMVIMAPMLVLSSVFFFEKWLGSSHDPLSSNVVRTNLLKNTFHYFVETFGFGVGAGNLPFYLKNEPIYETNQVVEVHNWLAEIMGNFGIIIFLGYLIMYAYLFYCLVKIYQVFQEKHHRLLVEACMLAMIGFLVSSSSPSTVSNLYFHWVFLGLVIATVSVFRGKMRTAEGASEIWKS